MATNNNNRVPELRFPGFTGEWVVKKLGEILDYEQPTPYLVSSESYKNEGTPVLTAGKTFILGYTDETSGVYDKIPVIIFDDFTTESKYVTFPFKAKSSAMKMLSLKDKTGNLYFAYISMLLNQKTISDHKRHWISETSQINILFPPTLAEQQKIADCLSSLDEEIAAEAQKADALKDHKKGLMQQLFPAISNEQLAMSNCVPKLRFPGFEGEWVVKKLGEIAELSKGKGIAKSDIDIHGQTQCIRYGELYTHYGEQIKTVFSRTNIPLQDLVLSEINDVIIPSSGETHEDIATASCILVPDVAIGGDINILRTPLNGLFLSYYLNSAKKHEIAHIAQGDAVVHLYGAQLSKLSICFPPNLAEQQKIADCLSELDEMISAQQQKVEALKEHKKGLMQKLFPKMSN